MIEEMLDAMRTPSVSPLCGWRKREGLEGAEEGAKGQREAESGGKRGREEEEGVSKEEDAMATQVVQVQLCEDSMEERQAAKATKARATTKKKAKTTKPNARAVAQRQQGRKRASLILAGKEDPLVPAYSDMVHEDEDLHAFLKRYGKALTPCVARTALALFDFHDNLGEDVLHFRKGDSVVIGYWDEEQGWGAVYRMPTSHAEARSRKKYGWVPIALFRVTSVWPELPPSTTKKPRISNSSSQAHQEQRGVADPVVPTDYRSLWCDPDLQTFLSRYGLDGKPPSNPDPPRTAFARHAIGKGEVGSSLLSFSKNDEAVIAYWSDERGWSVAYLVHDAFHEGTTHRKYGWIPNSFFRITSRWSDVQCDNEPAETPPIEPMATL